jgi:hypothetical protein
MPDFLDLTTNPLFQTIKPQPDDQRKYLILVGYVAGTINKIVTVYENLDLCTYLEIPQSAIVWAEKAIPGQESSPTKLVIEATAKVNRVTTAGREVEAGYLSGLIASTYLTKAVPGVTIDMQIDRQTGVASSTCSGPVLNQPRALSTHGTSNCHVSGVCVSDPIS